MTRPLAAMLVFALASACGKPRFPREGMTLAGRHVAYSTLRNGLNAYGMYCRNCHGESGDGRGIVALGLRPAPRDFRLGIIKFAAVASGQLPNDADLTRAVRGGLHGTAMLAFEIPDDDLDAIVQYVKTFAPRWRTDRPGAPIAPTRDPWRGRERDAESRGATIYHGLALCWTCHPAYLPRDGIVAAVRELQNGATPDVRADVFEPVVQTDDSGARQLPPDFVRHPMKSGDTLPDLYRTVACGVGGTAMPTWHDVLPEPDLWALVHYVHSLTALRDTPGGTALEAALH